MRFSKQQLTRRLIMSDSIYVIYKHTSPSGKSYIGLTNNLTRRITEHKSSSSGCVAFSKAIQKYGWDSFTTEILSCNLTLEEANILEETYIRELNTLVPNGYNLQSGGNVRLHSDESKQRMSDKRKGIPKTDEHKHLLSKSRLGTSQSEETKRKKSESLKGKPKSDIAKQKARDRIQTEETRQKIRKIRTGTTRSNETKQKMSQQRKGRKLCVDPITGKRSYYFPVIATNSIS